MKTPGIILTRVILSLIILAVGTYVIFIILEIVAIPSPAVQTYLSCPEETNIKYIWVKESWNQPGETTMEKNCIDSSGRKHDAFPDNIYFQREYNLFMPIGFAIMLVIEVVWLVIFSIKKGPGAKRNQLKDIFLKR